MCRDRGYTPTKHEHIIRWKVDEADYFETTYNQIAGGPGLPVILYDGRVHNGGEHAGRMPLVIGRDMEKVWLNPGSTESELREVMHYKIPARRLKTWPVHTIRGKNARTGPAVLDEWKEYKGLIK